MNIEQALKMCKDILSAAGIDDPAFEARCITEDTLGLSRSGIIARSGEEINAELAKKIAALAKRRAAGEPLQYILRKWSFMGFDFCVGKGVLIPRDDTEVVLQLCIDFLSGRQNKRTLDLCSGSGAIAVSLNKICGADITAVELSAAALPYLYKNIKLNGSSSKVFEGDIFNCHSEFDDESFDLIVSNPPYIQSDEISELQAEVQFEPKIALDGGTDGLKFYRAIVNYWSSKLKEGGALAFELGENQSEYVETLMLNAGFGNIKTELDLGGTTRAIIGVKL